MSEYLNSFRFRNQNKLDLNQMDQKHIELSSLFEFSQTLNSSLNLKSILDNLLFMPMGRMMVGKGMILLAEENNLFRIATVKGINESVINNTLLYPNKTEEVVLLNDDKVFSKLPEALKRYKFKLIIPIKLMNKIKGLIVLGPKLIQKDFDEGEIDFLSSIGSIAAPAIENAQIFQQLNSVNHRLDQKIQELNTLFEIGSELNRVFESEEILKRLAFSLMGQMTVNQFFVAVKGDNGQLKMVYKKGSYFSDKIIQDCISSPLPVSKQVLIIDTSEKKPEGLKCDQVKLIVPMVIQEEIKGYIFIGEKFNKAAFTESDSEFLLTLANIAIISLENARLFEETLEKKRLEEELKMAQQIQSMLLPAAMPKIEGYDIHGFNVPSKHVGGDYYDVLKLNDNEYIFTIADVSGKGMPASLLMSNLQAGLHTLYAENHTLAEITSRLNNLIFRNTGIEKYITFFISKINLAENKLEYVNAGHNPPYLFLKDGKFKELKEGGIIIGMMENMPFETGVLEFEKDSILTMFTDGVTEAMNSDDIPFDEFRVINFFKENLRERNTESINKKLIDSLYAFAGDPTKDDDITILTIRRDK